MHEWFSVLRERGHPFRVRSGSQIGETLSWFASANAESWFHQYCVQVAMADVVAMLFGAQRKVRPNPALQWIGFAAH